MYQYLIFGSHLFIFMLFDEDISDFRDNSFDDVIQAVVSVMFVWVSTGVIKRVDSTFNSFIKLINVEDKFWKVFNCSFGN